MCAYPSSLAQLLFNCSRLTGNSSARQTDSQSRQQDIQPAMRSLPLSTCPCDRSLLPAPCSVRRARVCVMRYLWLHCTRRRRNVRARRRERRDGKEIANCHSNWLFQSPNFQLLSCNLIQSEDVAVAASASASVELCI